MSAGITRLAFRERRRPSNVRSERIALASADFADRRCAWPAAVCAWLTNVSAFVRTAVRASRIDPEGTCARVVSTSACSRQVTAANLGPVAHAGNVVVVVVDEGVVVVVTAPGWNSNAPMSQDALPSP